MKVLVAGGAGYIGSHACKVRARRRSAGFGIGKAARRFADLLGLKPQKSDLSQQMREVWH
jgi:hypothetical protein